MVFLRIEPEFIPFATNLHVETWILLADNDMGWYRILLSETHLVCHLTPYLHLRKYLIICKSKEKCSKQILAPVLVEIDNTCRQRFSVKLCQKTSCLLQFAICFTISTGLFVVVYFRILRLSYYAQIFLLIR